MKCVYEELSEQECKCFCGGDKAMRSLLELMSYIERQQKMKQQHS